MEKLILSLNLVNNALATLADSFEVETRALILCDEGLILAAQDSTIQRFEYSHKILKSNEFIA